VVEILNDRMTAMGASRHWLAKQVEGRVSRSQLYDILSGKRIMDLAEMAAICEVLELTPSQVLVEAQYPRLPQEPPDVTTSA
jgi:hypothetical protein